jgi:hypothetical protein
MFRRSSSQTRLRIEPLEVRCNLSAIDPLGGALPDPLPAGDLTAVAADPVAGVCHGVSALAWARVDGVSPLNSVGVGELQEIAISKANEPSRASDASDYSAVVFVGGWGASATSGPGSDSAVLGGSTIHYVGLEQARSSGGGGAGKVNMQDFHFTMGM